MGENYAKCENQVNGGHHEDDEENEAESQTKGESIALVDKNANGTQDKSEAKREKGIKKARDFKKKVEDSEIPKPCLESPIIKGI